MGITVSVVGAWVLRERFATDGGEVAWDRLGRGPPVVLVHGTPWSSWTWAHVAARPAEDFTVYVFDLLGFGASGKRRGQDVSLATHVAHVLMKLGVRDRVQAVIYAYGSGLIQPGQAPTA